MTFIKMVIIPFVLLYVGIVMMFENPTITLVFGVCGLASAILYGRSPFNDTYVYKPYIVISTIITVFSVALLYAGISGVKVFM